MYSPIIGDIPGYVAFLLSSFIVYQDYFAKPKIRLKAQISQYDYNKGMNTYLAPVNEIQIFISNHSKYPVVICGIKLIYKNTQESEKGELDRLANYQINKAKNTTLNQSEEIMFKLSYSRKTDDKLILDRLEDIIIALTSSHEYKVGKKILKPLIQELKGLKPPNSDNLRLARLREKIGQGHCIRQD